MMCIATGECVKNGSHWSLNEAGGSFPSMEHVYDDKRWMTVWSVPVQFRILKHLQN